MDRKCAIGVDLGGQSLKMAAVDTGGECAYHRQTSVNPELSAEDMANWLTEQINALVLKIHKDDWLIQGIGIVMPGIMNRERTKILFAANLPGLRNTDMPRKLAERLDLPVQFDADSNGAAIGEYHFGAGRGVQRLTAVVVGTGVGAGVVCDGEVVRNFGHTAGSLGHIFVDPQGQHCACGGRGCLETKASGRALERMAEESAAKRPESLLARLHRGTNRLTGAEVYQAMQQGDDAARQIVNTVGWWLGAGLATWSAIFKPDMVIIGGQVARLGQPYLQAVRRGLNDVGQPFLTEGITISPAALGVRAGIIGAASMFLKQRKA